MPGFMGDAIIILILGVVVFFAGRSLWKNRHSGGCSGDCSSCGKCSGSCRQK